MLKLGIQLDQIQDSLEFAIERGDLSVIYYLQERHGLETCQRLLPDGELAAWIARAEAHEAVHGEDSFLSPDHRFNLEMLPILNRQAAGEKIGPEDLPAPRWNLEKGWHHN